MDRTAHPQGNINTDHQRNENIVITVAFGAERRERD
jgi:hypothetical protein